jgi:hypothetical protein
LRGLPSADLTLVAHATALHEKNKKFLMLDRDFDSLELRLSPLPTNRATPPVVVLECNWRTWIRRSRSDTT